MAIEDKNTGSTPWDVLRDIVNTKYFPWMILSSIPILGAIFLVAPIGTEFNLGIVTLKKLPKSESLQPIQEAIKIEDLPSELLQDFEGQGEACKSRECALPRINKFLEGVIQIRNLPQHLRNLTREEILNEIKKIPSGTPQDPLEAFIQEEDKRRRAKIKVIYYGKKRTNDPIELKEKLQELKMKHGFKEVEFAECEDDCSLKSNAIWFSPQVTDSDVKVVGERFVRGGGSNIIKIVRQFYVPDEKSEYLIEIGYERQSRDCQAPWQAETLLRSDTQFSRGEDDQDILVLTGCMPER